MVRMTLEIEGMACPMCESRLNDAVRKSLPVKKVTSSRRKRRTEIIAETEIGEAAVRAAIAPTGSEVTGYRCEPYEKKGFRFFGR